MFKLFSVDDHIVEPPGVWVDRVPATYRDRVPHAVEADGRQTWVWDGGQELTMGLNAVAGKPREQWGAEPARFDHIVCESDYPHADTTFPGTQNILKALFEGVPDEEVALMTHRNAERLFDFPLTVPDGFEIP